MGVIKRQTIKGAAYSYLGVVVGFFATGLIMPNLLSREQVGLTQILIAISTVFVQFSSLGFTKVTERLFSYFRDNSNHHNGFVFLMSVVGIAGFSLSLIIFFILKPSIIESNIEKSPLLVEYIYYLIPLIFFRMFFLMFDTYNKMLFDATTGIFLSDLVIKIGTLVLLIPYFLNFIDFQQFIFWFILIQCFPAVYLLALLIYRNQFNLQPQKKFFTPFIRKEFINLSVFGLLGGVSSVALSNIDKIILNEYFNLATAGVYIIGFYFGTIIQIPNKALGKISSTVIADAWKDNDLKTIDDIYYKSSINQTFVGLLLFILMVANLHNIFKILPPEYSEGYWVIVIISLAHFLMNAAGVSVQIINTSHKYKIQTYSLGILLVITVVLYLIFIPIWGMNGAALGFLLSWTSAAALRVFYLRWNMQLFPFRLTHLKCLFFGLLAFLAGKIIPVFDHFLVDLIIRCSAISIVFIGLCYRFTISEDLVKIGDNVLVVLRIKRK